jgi:hypothetical protein
VCCALLHPKEQRRTKLGAANIQNKWKRRTLKNENELKHIKIFLLRNTTT